MNVCTSVNIQACVHNQNLNQFIRIKKGTHEKRCYVNDLYSACEYYPRAHAHTQYHTINCVYTLKYIVLAIENWIVNSDLLRRFYFRHRPFGKKCQNILHSALYSINKVFWQRLFVQCNFIAIISKHPKQWRRTFS